ncbi:MAG: matrixin family metalloprotease, partial [Terriglobales bacterium]
VTLEREQKRTAGIVESDNDYLNDAMVDGVVRWSANKQPVEVYIKSGAGVAKYRDALAEMLKQSFKDWEDASDVKIKFAFTDNPNQANISCSWTSSARDGISSAEGGHTMVVPDGNGNILNATMSLITLTVGGNELPDNYARRVFLHEAGHASGILGHSKNPNDIMFASISPGDKPATITQRDKNTVIALYTADPTKYAHKPGEVNNLVEGDPNSPLTKLLLLNNEAKVALDKGNVQLAVQKLEAAHKIDASNPIVNTNLGSAYANLGIMAVQLRDLPRSEAFFKKAIPLLEHGTNRINLAPVLKAYSTVLKMSKRPQEAALIDQKLHSIGGQ